MKKKAELLKEFIKFNPNINHQDFNGYSALHFAVQEKFIPAIDLLLERTDLQIDLQDKWGNTPLWKAIMNSFDEDIIIKLLEKGADIKT